MLRERRNRGICHTLHGGPWGEVPGVAEFGNLAEPGHFAFANGAELLDAAIVEVVALHQFLNAVFGAFFGHPFKHGIHRPAVFIREWECVLHGFVGVGGEPPAI